MTLLMVALLVGLGLWQVRRLAWKQGILAAMDRAEAAPPIALPAHPLQFQKVAITGTLQPGHTLLYGADVRDTPTGPQMGGRLIQPLLPAPTTTATLPVLIDRGWVPDTAAPPTPPGPVTIQAYVRLPDHPRLFTPADDPAGHRVYTLNPTAMAHALGLAAVAPFTLVALGPAPPGGPIPATVLPRPPNDHLSYAITWFGLAFVVATMFALWARRTLTQANTAP